jgi:hypothetical protein
MSDSKATQETEVAQGLALGALMLGVENVTGKKTTLEYAFRDAWRDWPHAERYPAIKTGPAYDDVFRVMDKSMRPPRNRLVHWESQWPYIPARLVDWDDQDLADVINEHIPAAQWADLVRVWLSHKQLDILPTFTN